MSRFVTRRTDTGRHYYQRPEWLCLTCGEPWPCEVRRADFLQRFAGEGMRLRSIMGALAIDAERDLRLTRDEAHARFAGWTLGLAAGPERASRSTGVGR